MVLNATIMSLKLLLYKTNLERCKNRINELNDELLSTRILLQQLQFPVFLHYKDDEQKKITGRKTNMITKYSGTISFHVITKYKRNRC
ncbi:hypothetical protein CoNPh26_CDS0089 [Staphylococcus phage S-CoN_Ph26]|nr:hypothetical protein CoNPh26_CDS0089 [Staphylococcus phage S-CoN_Ph26]